jgi:hypothetical protein
MPDRADQAEAALISTLQINTALNRKAESQQLRKLGQPLLVSGAVDGSWVLLQ